MNDAPALDDDHPLRWGAQRKPSRMLNAIDSALDSAMLTTRPGRRVARIGDDDSLSSDNDELQAFVCTTGDSVPGVSDAVNSGGASAPADEKPRGRDWARDGWRLCVSSGLAPRLPSGSCQRGLLLIGLAALVSLYLVNFDLRAASAFAAGASSDISHHLANGGLGLGLGLSLGGGVPPLPAASPVPFDFGPGGVAAA